MSNVDAVLRKRERTKQWKAANRERVQRVRRNFYQLHKQREAGYGRRYRWDKADEISERRFRLEELERRLEEGMLAELAGNGLSVVSISSLQRPDYIFELNGRRITEYLRAPLPTW